MTAIDHLRFAGSIWIEKTADVTTKLQNYGNLKKFNTTVVGTHHLKTQGTYYENGTVRGGGESISMDITIDSNGNITTGNGRIDVTN